MSFENICFLKKNNGFLSFSNLFSANMYLKFSIDKSLSLCSKLNFALHSCFIFLKWSLFLVQRVFIKVRMISRKSRIFSVFLDLFSFHSISIMGVFVAI